MNQPRSDRDTALDHATTRWHETNIAVGEASGNGNPSDPYLYAALLDARAGWWDHIGQLTDFGKSPAFVRDVHAIACSYAAILDRQTAAETRFRYRIPTLHPGIDASLLGLTGKLARTCPTCQRPWEAERTGACPACPGLVFGVTPHSHADVGNYPPGIPWTPTDREPEADGD